MEKTNKNKKMKSLVIVSLVFVLALSLSVTSLVPDEDTVIAWKMENVNPIDVSGQGNNGTGVNSPAVVTGLFGDALTFDDATSDHVVSVNNIDITGADERCMLFWAKPNATIAAQDDGALLGFGDASGSGSASWVRVQPGSAGFWGNGADIDSTGYNPSGNWEHYAYVYDGATGSLYIDGILNVSGAQSLNTGSGNPTKVYAGIQTFGAGGWEYRGLLDEVMIMNRTCNATERQSHFDNGIESPPDVDPPVLTDREPSGNVALDPETDFFFNATFTDANPDTIVFSWNDTGVFENADDIPSFVSGTKYTLDDFPPFTIEEGQVLGWYVSANDTLGNTANSSLLTVTGNIEAPNVTSTEPDNNLVGNATMIVTINATATDFSPTVMVLFTNESGGVWQPYSNISYTSGVKATFPDDITISDNEIVKWGVEARDSLGLSGFSQNWTITGIDATAPSVLLREPFFDLTSNATTHIINFSATDNSPPITVNVQTNASGTFTTVNTVQIPDITLTTVHLLNLSEGDTIAYRLEYLDVNLNDNTTSSTTISRPLLPVEPEPPEAIPLQGLASLAGMVAVFLLITSLFTTGRKGVRK